MAIITERLGTHESVWGKGKAMLFTRLVKEDIIRQGITGWTQTVQKVRIPHDPQTQPQLGIRALIQFIYDRWWAMTPAQQQTWKDQAATYPMQVIAFYLWQSMLRWIAFATPSIDWPATESSPPISIPAHTYTGGKGFATLSLTPSSSTSLYGLMILRSSAEITAPDHSQVITLLPHDTTTPLSFTDSPLLPGTYHYRAAAFNTDGTLGPILSDETVLVS